MDCCKKCIESVREVDKNELQRLHERCGRDCHSFF